MSNQVGPFQEIAEQMTDLEIEAAVALRRLALNEDVKAYVLEHTPLYKTLLRAAIRFIGGETLADGIEAAGSLNEQGHAVTIDYMGEARATLRRQQKPPTSSFGWSTR